MSAPLRSLCMKGYENRVFTALQSMRETQAKSAAALRAAAAEKKAQTGGAQHPRTLDRFEKQQVEPQHGSKANAPAIAKRK